MKNLIQKSLAAALVALIGASSALAADPFPNKPIRVIVHSAPGGLLDVHTRTIAQKMSEFLGQPLIIDNRPGAGGLLGFRTAKAAPADGYTILAAASTFTIQPALLKDPGYDPEKDFVGVGGMTRMPSLVMVPANTSAKNLTEYMAQARANPGQMNYASGGVGSSTHLGAASFVQRAGVNLLHVPYKGNSAAWPDLIGGRVGMIFEPYGTAAPMIRDGRTKALGVTSTSRLAVLPDVPTVSEQGLSNWSYYIWFGMLAPAGTPKEVVQRLSEALRVAMTSTELKDKYAKEGAETMVMNPEEFSQFVKGETVRFGKLAADLNIPKE